MSDDHNVLLGHFAVRFVDSAHETGTGRHRRGRRHPGGHAPAGSSLGQASRLSRTRRRTPSRSHLDARRNSGVGSTALRPTSGPPGNQETRIRAVGMRLSPRPRSRVGDRCGSDPGHGRRRHCCVKRSDDRVREIFLWTCPAGPKSTLFHYRRTPVGSICGPLGGARAEHLAAPVSRDGSMHSALQTVRRQERAVAQAAGQSPDDDMPLAEPKTSSRQRRR